MSEEPVEPPRLPARVTDVLMTEESIYGIILVSGMIVVSNNLVGTSANALLTVTVTVAVFCAHVFAGTLARLAAAEGHGSLRRALRAAAGHSRGMLVVAIVPLAILTLGVTRVLDDEAAIWTALLVDVVILGVLGWTAVARWNPGFWLRAASALITAGFGVLVTMLKVLVHH